MLPHLKSDRASIIPLSPEIFILPTRGLEFVRVSFALCESLECRDANDFMMLPASPTDPASECSSHPPVARPGGHT